MLTLTIKKSTTDSAALVSKDADAESVFTFAPTDTEGLAFGEYKYDVQLTTAQDEVYTVIPVSKFVLLEEVTWTAPSQQQ